MSKRFGFLVAVVVCVCLLVWTPPAASGAKNVILMISDGAGFNTWDAASMYQGRLGKQVYDGAGWVRLACTTYPLSRNVEPSGSNRQDPNLIYDPAKAWDATAVLRRGAKTLPFAGYEFLRRTATDSAAAGTAMATGVKTFDNAINWSDLGEPLAGRTIAEIAKGRAKRIGVVTSVQWSHATPATLGGAHNASRDNYAAIANEMLDAPWLDLIMGAGHPEFDDDGKPAAGKKQYKYVGGAATWERLRAGKHPGAWTLVETKAGFESLAQGPTPAKVLGVAQAATTLQAKRGKKKTDSPDAAYRPGDPAAPGATPFACPFNPHVPSLETMTRAALNCLDDHPGGFFLMIEGGAVDWANHANQAERMIEEQIDFLGAVEAVVGWVEKHSHWDETLVILTSDHETGVIWGPRSDRVAFEPIVDRGKARVPGLRYHCDSHGNSLVPLYARGPDSDQFLRLVRGTDAVAAAKHGFSGQYVDNTDIFAVMRLGLLGASRSHKLPACGASFRNRKLAACAYGATATVGRN